ncbi:MAG: MFS transporter [Treponema sp.]|nr:MFS transporter [Treponema sp.]
MNRQRLPLFFLLFGTMLLFGLIENIKGVSYPLIKAEFNASWEQQGLMVSMFSFAYVGFSIVAGIFLGKFGIKPSFLFGFAALSIGLVLVFFMPSFFTAAAAIFVIFAGFGFFEVGVNALASRVFTARAGLLMSLLHSFYGIGAIAAPKAAGMIAANAGLGWRYVYLFSLPLALLLFIPAIFTGFPKDGRLHSGADSPEGGVRRKSFFDALHSPLVWLFSVTLGLAMVVEMNSANWGPLYFQDVYGLDPRSGGAAFLSTFFLAFTFSRLVCGVFVEKIGYMRSLLGLAVIILAVFLAGFCLGEKGVFVLPVLGFFIALLWPTIMALAIVCFGADAPVFSSAMIAIGGTINASVQFLVGLTNRLFGPAWGYRSSLVYTVLLAAALIILSCNIRPVQKPVGS